MMTSLTLFGILITALLLMALPAYPQTVTTIIGANADSFLPPCQLNLDDDGSLTLASGTSPLGMQQINGGMAVVVQLRNANSETWLSYVNIDRMVLESEANITATMPTAQANTSKMAVDNTGKVYFFNSVGAGVFGCAQSICSRVVRFDGLSVDYAVTDIGPGAFSFLDNPTMMVDGLDTRLYVIINCLSGSLACTAGQSANVQLFMVDKSTGLGTGYIQGPPNTDWGGCTSCPMLSFAGQMYFASSYTGAVHHPRIYRAVLGGLSPIETVDLPGFTSTSPIVSNLYTLTGSDNAQYVGVDTGPGAFSATQAGRGFIEPNTFTSSVFLGYLAAENGGMADRQGTNYDPRTNRVYTRRTGGDPYLRTAAGPVSITTQQNFACATAFGTSCASVGTTGGATFFNHNGQKILNLTSSARVQRVKLCS